MATDLSPIDVTTDGYAALYDQLNAQLEAMMTGLVAEVTGQPDDALRLNREAKRFERWDDAAGQWKPVIDRYDMDVTRLGGQKPATAATAHSIAQRLAGGQLKAGVPSAPDDVLRAFELAQHLEADNPHELGKTDVELGEVNNAAQLERGQNLADIPDKTAARGPSGLDLGDAARRTVGAQKGFVPLWEDIPVAPDADWYTKGLIEVATSSEHRNPVYADRYKAASPYYVDGSMGFLKARHRKSGQIEISSSRILAWNHYEYELPDLAWASLVCISPEHGYSSGDGIDNWRIYDQVVGGPGTIGKSTTSTWFSTGDSSLFALKKTAGADADHKEINFSKWRMVFHAVWYD